MKDNTGRSRFELEIDGDVVFADYRHAGESLVITHVEAPPHLRGSGAAPRLMQEIAQHARAGGLKLTPRCGYAVAWFRRNRAFADVLG